MRFVGKVRSGVGQSSGHMSIMQHKINSRLQCDVLPGSLNLLLDKPVYLKNQIRISTTHYPYPYYFYPCVVNGIDMFIMRPPMNKSPYKFELVATFKLRDKFQLVNGDLLEVDVNEKYINKL